MKVAVFASNTSVESRYRIRSAVRLRPVVPDDMKVSKMSGHLPEVCVGVRTDGQTVELRKDSFDIKHFVVDHALSMSVSQRETYDICCKDVVEDVIGGYHGSIIAYGQTGSGKSFTVFGTGFDAYSRKAPRQPGLVHFAAQEVFKHAALRRAQGRVCRVVVSFFQIYIDSLSDLLAPSAGIGPPRAFGAVPSNIVVREDPMGGVMVEGLRSFEAKSEEELYSMINAAVQNRITKKLNTNDKSSRSHAILQISIEQEDADGLDSALSSTHEENNKGLSNNANGPARSQSDGFKEPPDTGHDPIPDRLSSFASASATGDVRHSSRSASTKPIRRSTLTVVDLAGSERVRKSGSLSNPKQLKEALAINKSITALGLCVQALAEASERRQTPGHIPFRDSKLTRILADSLGGSTRTCIVATVGPCICNYEESLSTLMFACRATSVKKTVKKVKPMKPESLSNDLLSWQWPQRPVVIKGIPDTNGRLLLSTRSKTSPHSREQQREAGASNGTGSDAEAVAPPVASTDSATTMSNSGSATSAVDGGLVSDYPASPILGLADNTLRIQIDDVNYNNSFDENDLMLSSKKPPRFPSSPGPSYSPVKTVSEFIYGRSCSNGGSDTHGYVGGGDLRLHARHFTAPSGGDYIMDPQMAGHGDELPVHNGMQPGLFDVPAHSMYDFRAGSLSSPMQGVSLRVSNLVTPERRAVEALRRDAGPALLTYNHDDSVDDDNKEDLLTGNDTGVLVQDNSYGGLGNAFRRTDAAPDSAEAPARRSDFFDPEAEEIVSISPAYLRSLSRVPTTIEAYGDDDYEGTAADDVDFDAFEGPVRGYTGGVSHGSSLPQPRAVTPAASDAWIDAFEEDLESFRREPTKDHSETKNGTAGRSKRDRGRSEGDMREFHPMNFSNEEGLQRVGFSRSIAAIQTSGGYPDENDAIALEDVDYADADGGTGDKYPASDQDNVDDDDDDNVFFAADIISPGQDAQYPDEFDDLHMWGGNARDIYNMTSGDDTSQARPWTRSDVGGSKEEEALRHSSRRGRLRSIMLSARDMDSFEYDSRAATSSSSFAAPPTPAAATHSAGVGRSDNDWGSSGNIDHVDRLLMGIAEEDEEDAQKDDEEQGLYATGYGSTVSSFARVSPGQELLLENSQYEPDRTADFVSSSNTSSSSRSSVSGRSDGDHFVNASDYLHGGYPNEPQRSELDHALYADYDVEDDDDVYHVSDQSEGEESLDRLPGEGRLYVDTADAPITPIEVQADRSSSVASSTTTTTAAAGPLNPTVADPVPTMATTTTLSILEFLASLPPSETLLVYPSQDGSIPPPPPRPLESMSATVAVGSDSLSELTSMAKVGMEEHASVPSTPSPLGDAARLLAGLDTVTVKARAKARWRRMQSHRTQRDSDDEDEVVDRRR